jgi:4'-phosphopantetheinyl transferase
MSCHSGSVFNIQALFRREPLRRELPLNVVDLWFARLPEMNRSLDMLLSADELRRALRFRFDRDAGNFVARRGLLRMILASYTGVSPSQLSFTYSLLGKPALNGSFYDLRFSLSQSGELAVYAVARRRNIGVDLERLQQMNPDISGIAKSFFSEEQIALLNDTPGDQKEEAFLRLWTQMEARGKASGNGIGELDSDPSGLNGFRGKCFSFTTTVPDPGYVVAVAVQGRRRCSLRTAGFHIPPGPLTTNRGSAIEK